MFSSWISILMLIFQEFLGMNYQHIQLELRAELDLL